MPALQGAGAASDRIDWRDGGLARTAVRTLGRSLPTPGASSPSVQLPAGPTRERPTVLACPAQWGT